MLYDKRWDAKVDLPFKTGRALKICGRTRRALIKILGMLDRGECADFSMSESFHACGTPSCIRGWVKHFEPHLSLLSVDLTPQLDRLFYPVKAINVKDQSLAAAALRNYLTTGEPEWDAVLTAHC